MRSLKSSHMVIRGMALFCIVLLSCSDSNVMLNIFKHDNQSNWLLAACEFNVINYNHSISIVVKGVSDCPKPGVVKEAVSLTIPGDSVGSYENISTWNERGGNAGYFKSPPNAFSAYISYIDTHFISGTFHGTVCSTVPQYCYDINDGEFQLNY